MGILIDVIALIIIMISAGVAYRRGFVKTFFGFVSTIVAIILACMLCKGVATYIKDTTEFDEWIVTSILSIEIEKSNDNEEIADENTLAEENTEDVFNFIDTLPESLNDALNFEETKNEAINSIAVKISDAVINILSWILIYIVVRVILLVVAIVCHGIMSIPFLKEINNLAGLILGGLMGVFRIYLILAIVYFVSNMINISSVVNAIQVSLVVSHMYNSNLLLSLIF